MRLINSTTLQLAEFTERDLPPYTILSHTWETEEVSFQDMQGGDPKRKDGYGKIQGCCRIATSTGFEYVWVDTCCIDKSSSAELTEAINSMYSWYQKADVCYVYLSDYSFNESHRHRDHLSMIAASRWFQRGWTLQELIAPQSVIFFDRHWKEIGTKHNLRALISRITDIQVEALLGTSLESFSIAQRMCWASRRDTTRVEDQAYSLMGIFGVHMPMIYGEGDHAFIRLQEEIIRRSTDHTIFAWATGYPASRDCTGGLFAKCPSAFANMKSIIRDPLRTSLPFEATNKGIHTHLPIFEEDFGILDCQEINRPGYNLAIRLTRKSSSSDTFHFDPYCGTVSVPVHERESISIESIYVAQVQEMAIKSLLPGFVFQSAELLFEFSFQNSSVALKKISPPRWSAQYRQDNSFYIYDYGARLSADQRNMGELYFWDDKRTWRFAVAINIQDPVGPSQSSVFLQVCPVTPFGSTIQLLHDGVTNWNQEAREPMLDRISWQHPDGWCIGVGMRRAIVSGKRTIIVRITDDALLL